MCMWIVFGWGGVCDNQVVVRLDAFVDLLAAIDFFAVKLNFHEDVFEEEDFEDSIDSDDLAADGDDVGWLVVAESRATACASIGFVCAEKGSWPRIVTGQNHDDATPTV